MNSSAVTTAPSPTSRQATRVSGSILKMVPNSSDTTANENAIDSTLAAMAKTEPVQMAPQKRSTTASPALTISDTSSRNASTRIRLNDSSRERSTPHSPACWRGGTSHSSSRLSLSSEKTVVAPTTSSTIAVIAANRP